MPSWAVVEEFVAVAIDAGEVRRRAATLSVSGEVRRRLSAEWGPTWRQQLTTTLQEVTWVWHDRVVWRCMSGTTLVVLSDDARAVLAVRPDWDGWQPGPLVQGLGSGNVEVAARCQGRLGRRFGKGWKAILETTAQRLASDGQLERCGPNSVMVTARDEALWIRGGDTPRIVKAHLGLPDWEMTHEALATGAVDAGDEVAKRLEEQFGDRWRDVLHALCRHLADAPGVADGRHLLVSDGCAWIVVEPGPVVVKYFFGYQNMTRRPWSPEEIRSALATGDFEISRKVKEALKPSLGGSWRWVLDFVTRRAGVPGMSAQELDDAGRVVHVHVGRDVVTVVAMALLEVILDGRSFPTAGPRVRVVAGSIAPRTEDEVREDLVHSRIPASGKVHKYLRHRCHGQTTGGLEVLCRHVATTPCRVDGRDLTFTDGVVTIVVSHGVKITKVSAPKRFVQEELQGVGSADAERATVLLRLPVSA